MIRYVLDIGATPQRKEFIEWLQKQGYIVNWPNRPTKGTYVNGCDVTIDQWAAETYQKLWEQFKGE